MTKDLYTSLPQQINRQINEANRNLNVNLGGIREVFQEGVEPIGISELGNSMDSQVKPAPASIRFQKEVVNGKMNVILVIEHSGQDDTGHQTNHRLVCDVYRDKNDDGVFQDNEFVGSVDLTVNSTFKDTDTPKDKEVRYKVLVKDVVTGLSNWSAPVIIDTTDNLYPYPTDAPIVITDGITSDSTGDICNAIIKIEKHYDDDFLKIEIQYRKMGDTAWLKQADIIDFTETITESGIEYYYQPLKNLTKGNMYQIQTRCVRKSGNPSDWSAITLFRAGDYVNPGPVRNADAINISQASPNLAVDVKFEKPNTGSLDIAYYKIFRWEYNNAGGAFLEPPTVMPNVTANATDSIYHLRDTTVSLNDYYSYQIIAVDNSTQANESTAVWTEIVQAVEQLDAAGITITWGAEDNNFPVNVAWTYTTANPYFYILFRESNTVEKKILTSFIIDKNTYSTSIPLNFFAEEYAKEFLEIQPWQTDDNYAIEIYDASTANGKIVIGTRFGTESFLINPKPGNVTNFLSSYDKVSHSVISSWSPVLGVPPALFSSLTGYEMRETDASGKAIIDAHPTQSETDLTAKNAVWAAATPLPFTLSKDSKAVSIPVINSDTPSDTPIVKYYLIKAVGNFFATYSRSSEFSKVIYSADVAASSAQIIERLPAPTVNDTTCALLATNSLKMSWVFNSVRKASEFILYASKTASNLANDIPNDAFIVWKGQTESCIIDKLGVGDSNEAIKYNTQYYFKVIPVDNFGVYGYSSSLFKNISPDAQFTILPQPKVTGSGYVRAIPFPTSAQTPAPLAMGTEVQVFNSRSVQFEIDTPFWKNIYADRINWYISINGGAYTFVKKTILDPAIWNIAGYATEIKESYTSNVDLVFFRIIAVLGSGDVTEGSKAAAIPSKYSKIDTEKPVVEFTKIAYSDGTNAINKNNYINKKATVGGLNISYLSSEKNANSGIQKTEYSLGGRAWTPITTPILNIPYTDLGADLDIDGKYRDITLQLRAYDNADNTETAQIVFRKDTVGPAAPAIPTDITYSVGRTIKFKWTNPTTTNRNIFDGVIFRIDGDDKEYRRTDGIFEYTPVSAPSNIAVKMYAVDIADNELELGSWTISNAAPKAPTGIATNASVGSVTVNWAAVTQDTNDMDEEVRGYKVDYAIAAAEPAELGAWTEAVAETANTNYTIAFSATQMDQLSADGSLNVWVRVRAIDYWGLAGAYATAMSAKPRTVTAVDMGGNIFKMKLTTNMTNTGLTDYILDANFIDAQYCGFTNSAITDYIRLDLTKTEWISEIKLKFRHSSTVKFLFKFEEVSGAITTDTWMYSASEGVHTFGTAGSILVTATPPPTANRYFEFSTSSADIADIARLFDQNFSTGKPIFAKSVTMYLYNAVGGTVDIVEFQPVIKSIANVFYGSLLELDTMASIRSKNDLLNYAYFDRYNFKIFGTNNAVPTPSAVEKVVLGKLSDNTYGAWFKDNIYIGGSGIVNAPIKIDSSGAMTINSTANSTTGTVSVTQADNGSAGNFTKCFFAESSRDYSTNYYAKLNTATDNNAHLTSINSEVIPSTLPSDIIFNRMTGFPSASRLNGFHTGTSFTYMTGEFYTEVNGGISKILMHNMNGMQFDIAVTSTYLQLYLTNENSLTLNPTLYFKATSAYVLGSNRPVAFKMQSCGSFSFDTGASLTPTLTLSESQVATFYGTTYFGSYYINNTGYISMSAIYASSYVQTGTIYSSGIQNQGQVKTYGIQNYATYALTLAYVNVNSPMGNLYPVDYYGGNTYAGDVQLYAVRSASYTSASSKIRLGIHQNGGSYDALFINKYGNVTIGGYVLSSSVTDISDSYQKCTIDASSNSALYTALNIKPYGGSNVYSGIFIDNPSSRNYAAVYATNNSTDNSCVTAINLGAGEGVWGQTATGTGVYGRATGAGIGIKGHSVGSYGGYFSTDVNQGRSLYSAQGSEFNGFVQINNLKTSGTDGGTVHWDSNTSQLYRVVSSKRYKKSIKKRKFNEALYKIKIVDFKYKESNIPSFGSIAEDIVKIYPELVFFDKDGKPEGISYEKYGILAVQALQEQRKEIDDLNNRLNALELLLTNKNK